MRFHFLLIIFLFVVSSKISIAQLEPFGLQEESITSMSAVTRDQFLPFIICAGTEASGVFKRDFSLPDTNWISLGLSERIITEVTIQYWEAGPGAFNSVYAGVQPNFASGDSTIIYKKEHGTGWIPADSGLILNPSPLVQSLKSFHSISHLPPLPVFLLYSFNLYRLLSPYSKEWLLIQSNNEWEILATSQKFLTGNIWIGGKTVNTETVLAKSLDFGNSWEFFLLDGIQSNITAMAIDPVDNDIVYVALGSNIIKTTNGGEEWLPLGLQNPNATFSSIVINPSNTEHLLVGGTTGENNFILYESKINSSNWRNIRPDSPLPGISGMVTDITNNEFSVYIATLGDGVYRYTTPVTSLEDESNKLLPDQFRLYQNYPNPFNPSTIIKYAILSRQYASLKVYDVLGNEIATLVNEEKPAGTYEVEWDASRFPSGVYFYQLKTGSFVETKKLVLMK